MKKIYGSRDEKNYLTSLASLAALFWLLSGSLAAGILMNFPISSDPVYRPLADLQMGLQLVGMVSCALAMMLRCMSKGVSLFWGAFPMVFFCAIFLLPMPFATFAVFPLLFTLLIVLVLPDRWEQSLRWVHVHPRHMAIPGPIRSSNQPWGG